MKQTLVAFLESITNEVQDALKEEGVSLEENDHWGKQPVTPQLKQRLDGIAKSILDNIYANNIDTNNQQALDKYLHHAYYTYSHGLSTDYLEDVKDIVIQNLGSLQETLEVNMNVVPHGHIGHATTAERLEAGEMELAASQDDDVQEELKDMKAALKSLNEEKKTLNKNITNLNKEKTSLMTENNRIKGIAVKASNKLQELNLENAKLIYMNRAWKSNSLNERQKNKLVEAISKCGSVDEAKIVYGTLENQTNGTGEKLPETLKETLMRQNNVSVFRQPTKINESINPEKERMRKLAGIK